MPSTLSLSDILNVHTDNFNDYRRCVRVYMASNRFTTISDLVNYLKKVYGIATRSATQLRLYEVGYYLPPDEPIEIICENEVKASFDEICYSQCDNSTRHFRENDNKSVTVLNQNKIIDPPLPDLVNHADQMFDDVDGNDLINDEMSTAVNVAETNQQNAMKIYSNVQVNQLNQEVNRNTMTNINLNVSNELTNTNVKVNQNQPIECAVTVKPRNNEIVKYDQSNLSCSFKRKKDRRYAFAIADILNDLRNEAGTFDQSKADCNSVSSTPHVKYVKNIFATRQPRLRRKKRRNGKNQIDQRILENTSRLSQCSIDETDGQDSVMSDKIELENEKSNKNTESIIEKTMDIDNEHENDRDETPFRENMISNLSHCENLTLKDIGATILVPTLLTNTETATQNTTTTNKNVQNEVTQNSTHNSTDNTSVITTFNTSRSTRKDSLNSTVNNSICSERRRRRTRRKRKKVIVDKSGEPFSDSYLEWISGNVNLVKMPTEPIHIRFNDDQ